MGQIASPTAVFGHEFPLDFRPDAVGPVILTQFAFFGEKARIPANATVGPARRLGEPGKRVPGRIELHGMGSVFQHEHAVKVLVLGG